MKGFKSPDFADRQATADAARKAAVEKFRTRPAPDSAESLAREQERVERARVREQREAERRAAKEIQAREKAEREAAPLRKPPSRSALAAERESLDAETNKAREAEMENERKAARDARYAARKARKK